jgi:PHD/YefM family antitoxin component YafN of YafNO toxin-antitoxin module
MQRIPSPDLQRNVDPVQEAALHEPIAITHHGRDRLVPMSAAEYRRLKRRDRVAVAITEMPEEFVEALCRQATEADPESVSLNHLLDEDPGEWTPAARRLLGRV